MEISALAQSLGITSRPAVSKALEFLRLASVRVTFIDTSRNVCCLELACKSLHVPIDREAAIRFSGLSAAKYNTQLSFYQNLVGSTRGPSAQDLCVQFGCVQLVSAVTKTLARLKEANLSEVSPQLRVFADFSSPVYIGVAFFATAKFHRSKVDRTRLLKVLAVPGRVFNHTLDNLLQSCPDLKPKHRTKKVKFQEGNALEEGIAAEEECSASDSEARVDSDYEDGSLASLQPHEHSQPASPHHKAPSAKQQDEKFKYPASPIQSNNSNRLQTASASVLAQISPGTSLTPALTPIISHTIRSGYACEPLARCNGPQAFRELREIAGELY
jgi:origin recognition complex subunit 6